uniref:Uncharacterized protein n=1 Tax=Marseillevirus LCMAC101 TaxID=2506602 RepID=A0A481YR05_9VIRU|nr:MAG: hypothetical protein LCMAC101_02880 [Marseillevirus LCMAC101]
MSIIINKWRVTITSNSSHEFVWRDKDQGAPTVGPNGDAITTSLSRIIEVRDPDEIKIKEENIPTGGHFKLGLIKVIAPANQVSTHETSFKFPINVLSATVAVSTDMQGDIMTWTVAPLTNIGTITTSISVSDTVITVQQTVIDNMEVGYKVRVADYSDMAGTYEDLGYCLGVDKDNLQITVETAATSAWSAALPTVVLMTVYWMENIEFGPLSPIEAAKNKQMTAYVPANKKLVCTYDNKHATDTKVAYCYFEYIY